MQIDGLPSYAELSGIALALALGLLVGIQRGWALRRQSGGSRFAGVRTYGLLGLAGGIAGALQVRASGLATVLLAACAALVVLGYWRASRRGTNISGTASLTGLICLAAGFLAGSDEFALASAATGVTVLVLSLRSRLHHLLSHIDEQEMMAIARFALIALVILPKSPDPDTPKNIADVSAIDDWAYVLTESNDSELDSDLSGFKSDLNEFGDSLVSLDDFADELGTDEIEDAIDQLYSDSASFLDS